MWIVRLVTGPSLSPTHLLEILLEIITYPHPTLRHTSKAIKRVDARLRSIIREMLDLMYQAKGIGLAANQVNLPIRLFVMNLEAAPDVGEEHVFINPVISRPKGIEEKEEGCLSLPGLYGDVRRPERVTLQAFDPDGNEFHSEVDGLFARCVQHETDHLDGILFIDRLTETGKLAARDELDEFENDFQSRLEIGAITPESEISETLSEWENRYCH